MRTAHTSSLGVPASDAQCELTNLALVNLATIADEIGVRVNGRAWLRALAARDREPLLCQMRAREMIRQVRGREDQRAVSEAKHDQRVGRSPANPETAGDRRQTMIGPLAVRRALRCRAG